MQTKLIRSKRKTLSIQVLTTGELLIRAPNRLSMRAIEKFIAEKQGWITKQQEKLQKNPPLLIPTTYSNGTKFPYLGNYYELLIVESSTEPLQFRNGFLLNTNHLDNANELFISWYKQKARYLLTDLVARHAAQHQLQYGNIRISSGRATLGSCNKNGNLNFSWRLMLMPPPVIEYIVVHELAHLIHHNHSRAFWNQVETMMPEYREHESWLKST